MKNIIIIPARYQSSRFPAKPLAMLKGATGISRSLVERSWRAALQVKGVDDVYVATDDVRIEEAVNAFGGKVIMTSPSCANGTERCADAFDILADKDDIGIIINLQGDAPLTPPDFVENIINMMEKNPQCQVATPILRCDIEAYTHFKDDRKQGRVGGTTAVKNNQGDALYFSKEVLPFSSRNFTADDIIPCFHHVGLYGYRPDALKRYMTFSTGLLESEEGLEQLRFLENGVAIRCVEVEGKDRVFWELNNPIDIERIEAAFLKAGIE